MLHNSIFFSFSNIGTFFDCESEEMSSFMSSPSPEMFKIMVCGLQISDCMSYNERETQNMKINRKQVDKYLLRVVGRQMAMIFCQKTNFTKRP